MKVTAQEVVIRQGDVMKISTSLRTAAYFNDSRLQATKAAGMIAGASILYIFRLCRILNVCTFFVYSQ